MMPVLCGKAFDMQPVLRIAISQLEGMADGICAPAGPKNGHDLSSGLSKAYTWVMARKQAA